MRAYLIVQRSTSPIGPISTTPGCPRSFAPSTVSDTRGPALIRGIPTKRHNCVSFLAGQPVEGNDVCRVLAEVAVAHPGRPHAEVDQTFYGLARSSAWLAHMRAILNSVSLLSSATVPRGTNSPLLCRLKGLHRVQSPCGCESNRPTSELNRVLLPRRNSCQYRQILIKRAEPS